MEASGSGVQYETVDDEDDVAGGSNATRKRLPPQIQDADDNELEVSDEEMMYSDDAATPNEEEMEEMEE
jgi:hypothetical protein